MNNLKLKGHRTGIGMNQSQAAKALNMTPKTYNHKENGKVEFKLSEVVSVALLLNMSMQQVNEIFFDNQLTERFNS